MYDFHYNYIQKVYDDKAKLLFTDTDSLCYIIETDDIYCDMNNYSHLFDTSNYRKDNFLYSLKNKKFWGSLRMKFMEKLLKK